MALRCFGVGVIEASGAKSAIAAAAARQSHVELPLERIEAKQTHLREARWRPLRSRFVRHPETPQTFARHLTAPSPCLEKNNTKVTPISRPENPLVAQILPGTTVRVPVPPAGAGDAATLVTSGIT